METPADSTSPAAQHGTKTAALFIAILLMLSPSTSSAQKGWDITLRPSLNFPTKEFGGATLRTGFGFEGAFSYTFMPHLSAIIGWGWNVFSADESFAGTDIQFTEIAYTVGMRYTYPIGESDFSYFVDADAVVNYVAAENTGGSLVGDSKYGFGWQAETGIAFKLGNFVVSPGVRYRASSKDITIENISTPADLHYVSVGAGLTWAF